MAILLILGGVALALLCILALGVMRLHRHWPVAEQERRYSANNASAHRRRKTDWVP
jgi:Tfp pilus assembly protein PilN